MNASARFLGVFHWLVLLALVACTPGDGPAMATDSADSDGSSTTTTTEPAEGSSTTSTDPSTSGGSSTDASSSGPLDSSTTGDSSSSDTTDTGATDTGATSTGADALCGDGLVEGGEACDDAGESAGCNADCTLAVCGDGLANASAGEACDGPELLGGTCQSEGFVGGELACTPGCTYELGGCADPPGAPVLALGFAAVKQFDFSWAAVAGADYYQLEESAAPGEPFVQLGGDVLGESISHTMPLHLRYAASYRLRACNIAGCTDSAVVDVVGSLAEAVGYVKASNTGFNDIFGYRVALAADGNTLAVSAFYEASNATGIDGNQANNSASEAGAVYVFVRDALGGWSQQAYVKASNTNSGDLFCVGLALSGNGDTLAVGAYQEDSNATGIGGNEANNTATGSGAAYVFVRDGMGTWSQQAYIKASNAEMFDWFGYRLTLAEDGNTLAVSAYAEDSSTAANPLDNTTPGAGAVYVFVRDGMGTWSQQAYIKASNAASQDYFGVSVALAGNGETLAVGAWWEDGGSAGIDGDQADDSASASGAVYVFVRDGAGAWSQQAYVKASNPATDDNFGRSVALSGDGDTLAVGADQEDSNATGIDGDQANDLASNAGAVYVFARDGAGAWSQQAYVKASNTSANRRFGDSVALSGDGRVLAVGMPNDSSNAVGIEGDPFNNLGGLTGAAFVFVRDELDTWSQQAYVKASNPGVNDQFGRSVALSGDGTTLAVGSYYEDSNATGIGGDQTNDLSASSGAVYLY